MKRRPVLIVGTLVIGAFSLMTLFHTVEDRARRRRWENTYKARSHLIRLAAAQEAMRAGDVDGNGQMDYWTSDVAGLAAFGLIDPDLARADARPAGEITQRRVPLDGYYFAALRNVDGPRARYAFVAFPVDGGRGSETLYIDEESYPIRRYGVWTGDFRRPTEDELKMEWSRCWGG